MFEGLGLRIKRNGRWASALLIFVTVVGIRLSKTPSKEPFSIKPFLLFGFFREAQTLIDPRNTNTTTEYYLLENLTSGLVIDDKSNVDGYRGVFASSWHPEPNNGIRFQLKDHLHWSDGSPMKGAEIADSLRELSQSNARHITVLKNLSRIQYNEKENSLIFFFNHEINIASLLHELSLADAGILHPRNLVDGWSVSSGPYSVDHYSKKDRSLTLKANHFNPSYNPKQPEIIDAFGVNSEEKLKKLFAEVRADMFSVGSFTFSHRNGTIIKNAPQVLRGMGSVLHFMAPEANSDPKLQKCMSALLQKALQDASLPPELTPEMQLIPAGYEGRITDDAITELSNRKDKKTEQYCATKKLLLIFPDEFTDIAETLTPFFNSIKSKVASLQVSYDEQDNKMIHEADIVFRSDTFKGNQADSIGSWSFLLSGDGPLSNARDTLYPLLQKAIACKDDKEKLLYLKKIHLLALEEGFAVPIATETPLLLFSEKIDPSLLNKFDLRPRYWLLRQR